MPARQIRILLQCFGGLLIAAATVGLLSVWSRSVAENLGWYLTGFLVAGAVGLIGGAAYRFGAKYGARSASTLTSVDGRPAVISSLVQGLSVAAKGLSPHLGLAFLEFMNTEDENLAGVMNEIGSFVAIGRPGERLPETGAARMYVTNAEWKERVLQLISAAALVVIRAGYTQGVWWEVATAVRVVRPERLLFALPFNASQYETFRLKASVYLPCRLPDYRPVHKRLLHIGSVRGFLYFEPNWIAHYLELKPSGWGRCVHWRAFSS